jgi:hypothetical protein
MAIIIIGKVKTNGAMHGYRHWGGALCGMKIGKSNGN